MNDYEVDYCVAAGGHGDIGHYDTMREALRVANRMKRDDKKSGDLGNDTQYIGVSTMFGDFAIVFVTREYLINTSRKYFKTYTAFKAWKLAAYMCLLTGRTETGNYNKLPIYVDAVNEWNRDITRRRKP